MPSVNPGPVVTSGDNSWSAPIYSGTAHKMPPGPGVPGNFVKNLDRRVLGTGGSSYIVDGWEWLDLNDGAGYRWVTRLSQLESPGTRVDVYDDAGNLLGQATRLVIVGGAVFDPETGEVRLTATGAGEQPGQGNGGGGGGAAPAAPVNMRATAIGTNDIVIAFDLSAGATGYELFFRQSGQAYPSLPQYTIPGSPYTLAGLLEDRTYTIGLRAIAASANPSTLSEIVVTTLPAVVVTGTTISATMLANAIAAANAAAGGSKDNAFTSSLISQIGSGSKLVAVRDGVDVETETVSGALTRSGSSLIIPAAATFNSSSNADIDTGTWRYEVRNAGAPSTKISIPMGATGSGRDLILSGDVVSGQPIIRPSTIVCNLPVPAFDSVAPPPGLYKFATLIDDMNLVNDYQTEGVPGKGWEFGPGYVIQGLMRGDALPNWTGYPVAYRGAGVTWPIVETWFIVVNGVGGAICNARIEVRNGGSAKRRINGQWVQWLNQALGINWANYYNTVASSAGAGLAYGDGTLRSETSTSLSMRRPVSMQIIHGGPGGYVEQNPADIAAMCCWIEARLVVDNPALPFDLTGCKLGLQMGIDYKNANTGAGADAVGGARVKKLTTDWQLFTFVNVLPDHDNPNGSRTYITTPINSQLANPNQPIGQRTFITQAELLASLPPGFTV